MSRMLLTILTAVSLLVAAQPRAWADQTPVFASKVLKKSQAAQQLTIKYTYPSIHVSHASYAVRASTDQFNRWMEARASGAVRTWLAEESRKKPSGPHDLTVTYRVEGASPRLISLQFKSIRDLATSAHPYTTTSTVNYDLSSGPFTLGRLFKPSSPYLKTIADACHASLEKTASDGGFALEPKGLAPEFANFANFSMTTSGLKFYFNPGQAAPYANGGLQATVPWASVEALLSATGTRLRPR